MRGGAAAPADAASLSLLGHGLAGFGAGQTVCVVVTPLELIKGASIAGLIRLEREAAGTAKLQMQTAGTTKLFTGPIDCAQQIVRAQGVRGLWHAFPATLLFRGASAFPVHGPTDDSLSLVRCARPPSPVACD